MLHNALEHKLLSQPHQRNSDAGRARAASPPGAVDVTLDIFRQLVQNHVG